jgi:hypothetical protein
MGVDSYSTESLFNQDIRDKKRTASGTRSKTGLRGYVGTMRMPCDLMSSKEKRQYRKCGKVVRYNMYETIMPFDEFKQLPKEEQSTVLQKLRERHKNKEIQRVWEVNSQTYYSLVNKLGLPTRNQTSKTLPIPSATKLSDLRPSPDVIPEPTPDMTKLMESMIEEFFKKQQTQVVPSGFSTSIDGEYDSYDLAKKLESLAVMLRSEDTKYRVTLTVQELK